MEKDFFLPCLIGGTSIHVFVLLLTTVTLPGTPASYRTSLFFWGSFFDPQEVVFKQADVSEDLPTVRTEGIRELLMSRQQAWAWGVAVDKPVAGLMTGTVLPPQGFSTRHEELEEKKGIGDVPD